jgi:hypothetical protein
VKSGVERLLKDKKKILRKTSNYVNSTNRKKIRRKRDHRKKSSHGTIEAAMKNSSVVLRNIELLSWGKI